MTLRPAKADVAYIVGHTSDRQGATAVSGMREYKWGVDLADQLATAGRARGLNVITMEKQGGAYRQKVRDVIEAIEPWHPRCVVELHFNAAPTPELADRFFGSAGLHWPGSFGGRELAKRLSAACALTIGTKDRGPRAQARSWNGPPRTDGEGNPVPGGPELFILKWTVQPAVILETHFGTHPVDHARALEALLEKRLAKAITAAVEDWVDHHG